MLPSGKEAGYTVEAVCEHPGCDEKIHRGMAFACGGDAGDQGGCSCEGYFCNKHRWPVDTLPNTHAQTELGKYPPLCAQCTSKAAFLDWIDEAEIYRADPKFAPDKSTMDVLLLEDCKHLPIAGEPSLP